MIRRISAQLPLWMQSEHPMLRYTLGNQRIQSLRIRYLKAFMTVLWISIFLLGGYVVASDMFRQNPFELPFSQMLSELLFVPVFTLQVVLQLSVLVLTINTIGEEKRRQTWDSVRTTTSGAALTLRTRWSAVIFYRLRGMLGVLFLARLILIVGILVDLTAFRGEYLNYLTASVTPEVPLAVGVLLLALTMTASLLLPVTGLGFDAAFGLLISTIVHQRVYVVLAQIAFAALRLAVIGVLLLAVSQFRQGFLSSPDFTVWLLLVAFAIFGDWGLSFLYLGFYGAIVWADVPFGIFIGLALMIVMLIQAALTDVILSMAIYRAERTG